MFTVRPLVAALSAAVGTLRVRTRSAILQDADCADLFLVTHAHFRGALTRRENFPWFRAWLERDRPDMAALFARL